MHYQLRRYTNQCPTHYIVFGVGATHTKRRGHMNNIIGAIAIIVLMILGSIAGYHIVNDKDE